MTGRPVGSLAEGLDVDRRRHVELRCTRAVAGLPYREELGQARPVARAKRRGDGEERVSESASDLALVQVRSALLDVGGVLLQELVILGFDSVAEDVDGLRLSPEPCGQLLRDEHTRPFRDLKATGDRVVVGDRHEIHPAALGQLVHLLRWRGALRKSEAPLYAQ